MQMDPDAVSAAGAQRPDGAALLPPLAYADATVFRLELQRLFGRLWLYVAHESELQRGGDFKTTYLGLQPVIVTRDPTDGQYHVLLNCCRHQRAVVCLEERGNTRVFRCGYHGWSYDNRGDLISVPDRRGNDEPLLPPREGLTRVPRVASYRGFLFASLCAEGESLTDQLAATAADLDWLAERHGPALQVQSPGRKAIYKANWKLIWEDQLIGGAGAPAAAGVSRPILPNLLLVGDEFLVLRPIFAGQTEVIRYGVSNAGAEVPASAANHAASRPPAASGDGDADQEALARRQAEVQRATEAQAAMRTTAAAGGTGAGGTAVGEAGARGLLGERPAWADPLYQRWWDLMSAP